MKRISIVPLAAALLLANAPALIAQEKTMTTSTGIEMVSIPPGEFMLGSTRQEQAWAIASGCPADWVKPEGQEPRKAVIKVAFWLGRTEVTVGQWKKFVSATNFVTDAEKMGAPQARKSDRRGGIANGANWKDPNFGFKMKDNHPVCCLSWKDAVAFCEWLTQTEMKVNTLPKGMVYRLPTEAEWEYACRAGTQTRFWWGDKAEGGEGKLNWAGKVDGFEFVAPVDHFRSRGRNKFGLADMLGNVREWCLDAWDPVQANPECSKGNSAAGVARGGAYKGVVGTARCAYRSGQVRTDADSANGFRVCCGAPQ